MKQLLGAITLTVLLAAQPALAQVAVYDEGSIYDLQPSAVQSTGNRILEQVLNSNDMQLVSELAPSDVLRKLSRPVGRLAIQLPENKIAYCTASLIDRDHIITNYHCVPGKGKVQAALLWMGYLVARSRAGVAPYGVNTEPVEANKRLDYAILRVSGKPGDEWGTIPLSTKSPTAYNSLFIVHHPGGFAKHISRGRCQTSDPALDGEDVLHICDTLGGSSGAPIFDNNTRKVVGLHYSAVSLSKLNAGKRIASIAEQSPLIARLARGIGKQPQNRTSTDPSERVWSNIKDTRSKAVLQTFIRNYPNSIYLDFAKARFRELAALDASADQTGGGQLDLSVSNQDEPEGTRSDSSLSGPALASAVQKELKRIGCYQGSIDGDWGRGSAGAVSLYNKVVNANWGRAPSQELLVELYGIAKLPVCKKALNGTANRFDGHWMVTISSKSGCRNNNIRSFLINVRQGKIDEPHHRLPKKGSISVDGQFSMEVTDEAGKLRATQTGAVTGEIGKGRLQGRNPKCRGIIALQRVSK